MLSVEWIPKLASLDLQWFVELAMNNIFWVFAILMITFVYNKKFSLRFFLIILIMIFSTVEFFETAGIVILVGGFLFVYYIIEVILLTFTENIPQLQGKIPFVLTIYFFLMIFLYSMGVF